MDALFHYISHDEREKPECLRIPAPSIRDYTYTCTLQTPKVGGKSAASSQWLIVIEIEWK
jgi:hypothetical protein